MPLTALLYWSYTEKVRTPSREQLAVIFTAIATHAVAYDSASVMALNTDDDDEHEDDRARRRDRPAYVRCTTQTEFDALMDGGRRGYKYDEASNGSLPEFVARTLIHVLRHLSGVEFRCASVIDMSSIYETTPMEPIEHHRQAFLSVCAFRLFTHMCMSSSPRALHLMPASNVDCAEPTQELVHSYVITLHYGKGDDCELIPKEKVERQLCKWSKLVLTCEDTVFT